MLFGTVAFAEDTAYSKLNDLEKEIYDCFMIMVSNFHNPKDARIYEMYDYKNNEENYFHGFIRRHSLRLFQ